MKNEKRNSHGILGVSETVDCGSSFGFDMKSIEKARKQSYKNKKRSGLKKK